MIKVLGIKRVVGIGILFCLCVAIGTLLTLYIWPQKSEIERDLRITRASIASSRGEIEQLRRDMSFFVKQKSLYESLITLGFFSDQDRFYAQKRLEEIQDHSNILHMKYNISPARVEQNMHASKANQIVLTTSISADVDALDDVDFYSLLYWLDNAFTGQSSITGFEMERVADVDDMTLRQIGSGTALTLLRGSVSFEWRTLIPKDDYLDDEGEGL